MAKESYSIGEISKIYNIGLDSIRYYEEIGLISPKRHKNNYRYYDEHDIYRLNIIRELLSLGFSSKDIENYFKERNVLSTFKLLKDEKNRIDEQIKALKAMRNNVCNRIDEIKTIGNIVFDKIFIKEINDRKYFIINEGYKNSSDMDILIHQIANKDKDKIHIIGGNKIGSLISYKEYKETNKISYKAVFSFSKKGEKTLDKGKYLSMFYKGDYNLTLKCLQKMEEYAKENNYELSDEVLEILWIDVHSTDNKEEYITEVEIKIK